MNRAVVIGNLTNEPELRSTLSGISVCTFTIAVNRRVSRDAQGQKEADFIPIVTWRGLADNCFKYLHKGSKAAVTGSIQTRSYDAQDGTRRYVTEVVADDVEFLTPAGAGAMPSMPPEAHPANSFDAPSGSYTEGIQPIDEDELPF